MKTLKLSMITAAVIAAMGMSTAFAAAPFASSSVSSSAEVKDKCLTVAPATISFVEYDATKETTADAKLELYCTKGSTFNVSLGSGDNYAEDSRNLEDSNGNALKYTLSKLGGGNWGEGSEAQSFTANGLLTKNELTVKGKIAAGQDKPAGTYSDTVTVTVNY